MTNDPHGVNSGAAERCCFGLFGTLFETREILSKTMMLQIIFVKLIFVWSFAQKSETTRLKIDNESSDIAVKCNS